jgi:hypothetical protein
MPLAGKWMELEVIMLNEISQMQEEKCHIFSLICPSWNLKKRRR